ncbi:CLUMA_CG015922, isoform A [Clunio marinus]|uniref:CLUMA_CG015922, isoform A n=1 Tax=Clunio marinus TaxID=568069 RepID=A0A1J1IT91_9DIPT|nr:CLUMA_CG015922, isoform A [Clunio marinus]
MCMMLLILLANQVKRHCLVVCIKHLHSDMYLRLAYEVVATCNLNQHTSPVSSTSLLTFFLVPNEYFMDLCSMRSFASMDMLRYTQQAKRAMTRKCVKTTD